MALPLNWLKRFFPIIFRARTTTGANRPFPSLIFFIIGRNLTGFATRTTSGTDLISTMLLSPQIEVPQPPWKEEERGLCSPVAEIEVAMKRVEDQRAILLSIFNDSWRVFTSMLKLEMETLMMGFVWSVKIGYFCGVVWEIGWSWERERELRSRFLSHTNWWLGFWFRCTYGPYWFGKWSESRLQLALFPDFFHLSTFYQPISLQTAYS